MPQVKRWARLEDWNPLSPQQVLSYLRSKSYRIPLHRKTRKPTTGKEGLATLRKLYPNDKVLDGIDTARKLRKAVGFLDDSRLGKDGRFHPTYTFSPDTGRLASINPNFQNQPNHGVDEDLARAIRETVIPSEGYLLMEADWKAIEAVLTGWFAEDREFMKLSLMDSHSYLGWVIGYDMGVVESGQKVTMPPPLDHPELEELLKIFKKKFPELRQTAKKLNHATSYGMGPKHLSEELKITIPHAVRLMAAKDKMSPKVAEWKKETQKRAHYEGFLENPFGYRRYFTDVYRQDGSLGDEARKALAFLPQSTAAAMCRAALVEMFDLWLGGDPAKFRLLVPIHDAVLLEVLPSALPEVSQQIKQIMERPWAELGGLSVEVTIKSGTNWALLA